MVSSLFTDALPVFAESDSTPKTLSDFDMKQLPFTLFAWTFRLLCGVLFTLPHWFFSSPWFLKAFYGMCVVAIAGIMVMGAWTGFKKGMSRPVTSVKSMLTRLALAFTGIGFAPFLLEKGTFYLNQLTLAIEKIGFYTMKDTSTLDSSFSNVYQTIQLDFWAMLLFDAILLYRAVPLMFKAGQRWFDLLVLGVVSPLAIASFVFDETKHYGAAWWSGLKGIALSQIYQVGFLAFIVILLFGTKGISSGGELLIRLLIIIGGLKRMNNPPPMASGGDAGMFHRFERKYNVGTKKLFENMLIKKKVADGGDE